MSADQTEPIAVIGFSAKFPGDGSTVDGFWKMLCEGRSARCEVPADRFNAESFYDPDKRSLDTLVTKHGYFIKEDPTAFDAPFFNISPAEASCMDPQQRSLLETTYHALENAGLPIHAVANTRTSVHVASFSNDFPVLLSKDVELQSPYKATGMGPALLANRISHFFDFKGPSVVLDTACSSSLYALHSACQSLRCGETNMGVVGGASAMLTPDAIMIPLSNAGFLSPDGKCYSFDHRANGYARGEGTGVLLLKRLSDALKDGNTIRSVIRATGTNQDGKTPGVTQPGMITQKDLILETYRKAGLSLDRTRFIEAHGTGTPVGDPIEANAIGTAFKGSRTKDTPLFVGAVKSNIGHLEGTSGIAALIKTILILETGLIPPNAEFEKVNPAIDADAHCFKFPLEMTSWPDHGLRRASINNFGYGGSNAHAVLDDAYNYLQERGLRGPLRYQSLPTQLDDPSLLTNGWHHQETDHRTDPMVNGQARHEHSKVVEEERANPTLLVFSAADSDGTRSQAEAFHRHLSTLSSVERPMNYLKSIAYTLSERRSLLPWKSFAVVDSPEKAHLQLLERLSSPVRPSSQSSVVFVFTGQGAQWPAMGRELMAYAPFRRSIEAADRHFRSLGSSWSLIDQLMGNSKPTQIHEPSISQAACTALQVALVDLLKTWNILPSAVVGHSSGEIAAAYGAGVLTDDSAWTVAYYRGMLAQQLSEELKERPTTMMAVALSEEEAQHKINSLELADDLFIGCLNGPANTTVTGYEDAIDRLKLELEQDAIFARKLSVTMPYHSPIMDRISSKYLNLISGIRHDEAVTDGGSSYPAFFSSVTGTKATRDIVASPGYWVKNLLSKVNFLGALQSLQKHHIQSSDGSRTFLEVGPSPALQRAVKDSITMSNESNLSYLPVLRRDMSATMTAFEMVGHLFSLNCKPSLSTLNDPRESYSARMLVDLPQYQFNRPQKYWLESRISRKFRLDRTPRRELLGTRDVDWNPQKPSWRNVIRTSAMPWVKDHVIGNATIYSAAGLLLMAVEAIREVMPHDMVPTGYTLKDVQILKAVVIDKSQPTEIRITLRSQQTDSKGENSRFDFEICSVTNDVWADVGHGVVQVEFQSYSSEAVGSEVHRAVADNCFTYVHGERIYETLSEFGFQYGRSFRVISSAMLNRDREVVAKMSSRNETDDDAQHDERFRLIHPGLLDGIFQLMVVGLSEGGAKAVPPIAFTQIRELWLSNDLAAKVRSTEYDVSSRVTFKGYRDVETCAMAVDDTGKPMVILQGNRGTAIDSFESALSKKRGIRRLCSRITWKPSLTLNSPAEIQQYLNKVPYDRPPDYSEILDEAEALSLYFLQETSFKIKDENLPKNSDHLHRYLQWMRRSSTGSDGKPRSDGPSESEAQRLISAKKDLHMRSKIVVEIGQALPDIMTGKKDALEIIFSGSLAQDYYDALLTPMSRRLSSYLDLWSHEDPEMKIVEVGAGVGSATSEMLSALTYDSGSDTDDIHRYSKYTFTDISTGFFDKAKDRFQGHATKMDFQKLDIAVDPVEQGFESNYDVVVASAVLHATKNLHETLVNVRRLLKPGGRLACIELNDTGHLSVQFWTGLLAGWWLSEEDFRQESPLVTEAKWDQLLRGAGFEGIELAFRDSDDKAYYTLFGFTAKAKAPSMPLRLLQANVSGFIIVDAISKLQRTVATGLQAECEQCTGLSFPVMTLHQMSQADTRKKTVIVLSELDRSLMNGLTQDDFDRLKPLCLDSKHIVWVTRGAAFEPAYPERYMINGFARSICSESGMPKIFVLGLSSHASEQSVVEMTGRVLRQRMSENNAQVDFEYIESEGMLHTGRVAPAGNLNKKVKDVTSGPSPTTATLSSQVKRCLQLQIGTPGLLDTLHFVDSDKCEKPLAHDEIEVEVSAAGMNFKDVLIALGVVAGASLGYDAAGIVRAKGPGAPFKVGDRVVSLSPGSFSTYLRLGPYEAVGIPENMSFTTAAATPSAFVTAWYSLITIARLSQGESVLIHAAAGGVGQAALQIAKMIGARIFATVGSQEKSQLLIDKYGIPVTHIFSTRNSDFRHRVLDATQGRGVDVVLNCLTGLLLQQSFECVAPLGRFIEIGKRDINANSALPMSAFSKNIIFASVDLEVHMQIAKTQLHAILEQVVRKFDEGGKGFMTPYPMRTYPASDITQAFQSMQKDNRPGKGVIEFRGDSEITISRSPGARSTFDGRATYLLAGGLGGLGQNIIRWMVSRGAKHFLVLSRSGAKSNPSGAKFVKMICQNGVRVDAPACDVSDMQMLKRVLDEARRDLPPIKGCIQASMVLRNELFESLSREDFQAAITPKVAGSWNLHECLSRDLDFYILLSSFAGIHGNLRQSNYAAGNTYQDALARYRTTQGLKCVSLDLGVIGHAGRLVAHKGDAQAVRDAGYSTIEEAQFLAVMDLVCDSNWPISPDHAQVILGVDTPETLKSRGVRDWLPWLDRPFFSYVRHLGPTTERATNASENLVDHRAMVREADGIKEASSIVAGGVRQQLARLLSVGEQNIDMTKPPFAQGVDSLIAIEVRSWFMKALDADVPLFKILKDWAITELSLDVAQTLRDDGEQANGQSEEV